MLFADKTVVGPEKLFSSTDLLQYVEKLIREKSEEERQCNHYGWLSSRKLERTDIQELEELTPIVRKMSPENCAAIAVKLDSYTDNPNVKQQDILSTFKKLLEEQDTVQAVNSNIKRAKEMKRVNKVHPEFSPPRQATVCFIVESNI